MVIDNVELREDIFNVKPDKSILWQVVRWQLAKRRQGTHNTKTRGELSYSNRKLLPQKGTGSARHGSRSANIFVGGSVIHGPKPRSYYYHISKKFRQKALKMALSVKAQKNELRIVDNIISSDIPKTKEAVKFLKENGLENKRVCIVIPTKDEIVSKSFRNIEKTIVLPVEGLNVRDILWCDTLVIKKNALDLIYKRFETWEIQQK